MNSFRRSLEVGDPLSGIVVSLPDPELARLSIDAWDFVWLDLEHGALDLAEIRMLTAVAGDRRDRCLVRLPVPGTERLQALLDIGVGGVVLPRVEAPEQVLAVTRCLGYPPEGSRGYAPRRANAYGDNSPVAEVCVVQIETAEGVRRASEILSVDGVDLVVVGCADLSWELGAPLDFAANALRAAVQRVREAASAAQVAFGIAAGGAVDDIRALLGGQARVVVWGSDAGICAPALRDAAARATSLWV